MDHGSADALEGGLYLRHGAQLALGGHGLLHAEQHLEAAASGGDDTHAHFHQTDVELGVTHHPLASHGQLAATTQGQVEGGRHRRERGVGQHSGRELQPAGHLLDEVELPFLGGVQHHHQVGPGAEVLPLVAHHQALEAAGDVLLDGLLHQADDAVVQGVHLAAEGQAGHVVAQVEELAAAVLGHHLALTLLALEDHHPPVLEDRIEGQGGRVQLGHLDPVLPAVEAGNTLGQHPLHQGRQGDAVKPQAGHHALQAQGVPQLEGAQLEGEAVADGPVHVQGTVGHFTQAVDRIDQVGGDAAPGQAAGLRVAGEQGAHLLGGVVDALQLLENGPVPLHLGDVLPGGGIQGQEGLLALGVLGALLEEALLRLVAQELVVQHVLKQLWELEDVALLVLGTEVIDVLGSGGEDVHARQIGGAEGRALGARRSVTQHHVHHFEGELLRQGHVQGGHDAVDADAVADEGGAVKGRHDLLAQALFQPGAEGHGLGGFHLRAGDELQQAQVAYGVEEVRDDEVAAEGVIAPLHQQLQGDAGGVGADPGAGLEVRLQAAVELALDGQVLLHHLHHPVAVRQPIQVIPQVAGADPLQEGAVHGQGRLALGQGRQGPRRQLVRRRLVNDDVQQLHLAARRSHMGRNPRPHHPRPQHTDFFDFHVRSQSEKHSRRGTEGAEVRRGSCFSVDSAISVPLCESGFFRASR